MRAGGAVGLALGLVFLCGCGCGGSGGGGVHVAPTVPVKGKVTYKGQPLTRGTITFEPEDSGRGAHGAIQPDGTFELTTFRAGDGAIGGVHRVAVSETGKGAREAVPVKFRNTTSSKVTVEVTPDKADYAVDFK